MYKSAILATLLVKGNFVLEDIKVLLAFVRVLIILLTICYLG